MGLDLGLLKKHLDSFADEFKLKIIVEVGELADSSTSINDFKSKLDELSKKHLDKTSSEILAGFSVRLAKTNVSPTSTPTENTPVQNEIDKVKKKIDKLDEKIKISNS